MNQFEFESSWNEIKGLLKQKYGQLTDNDLQFVEGKGDELLGRLQSKLGMSADELNGVLRDLQAQSWGGVGGRFREQIGQAKAKAAEMASDVKAKVAHAAGDLRAAATARTGEMTTMARERAQTMRTDGEEYVRQNPRQALIGALAAGFVVGLLLRR
jgi:uncharacterized protein YjbJ (UPF0337 family)